MGMYFGAGLLLIFFFLSLTSLLSWKPEVLKSSPINKIRKGPFLHGGSAGGSGLRIQIKIKARLNFFFYLISHTCNLSLS